jgi:hypothetical protein
LATGPKFSGDAQEREGEPQQKIHVGGNALAAEAQLEGEEFPKHSHDANLGNLVPAA